MRRADVRAIVGRSLAVLMALALLGAACGSDGGGSTDDEAASPGDSASDATEADGAGDTEPTDDQAEQPAEAETGADGSGEESDDEEPPRPEIDPLIPVVDGRPQVRSTWPIAEPLDWMLDALAAATTTEEAVSDRFSPDFLSAIPAGQVVDLVTSVGSGIDGFETVEVVYLTPIAARIVIGDPTDTQGHLVDLLVEHSTGSIVQASINPFPYDDGNTYPQDAGITFDEAMIRLGETATEVGAVVAEIDGGACTPLMARNADRPLATGSNFKGYVLGALATAVDRGELALDTPVVVTDDERAPGSFTDDIVAGTELTLLDAAVMMMGNSDNTMTDHLHELVGREAVEAFVVEAGHAEPELLTPFVSVNEWDNLIFSISNEQAAAYLAGSDEEQRALLEEQIVPMGGGRQGGFANYDETLALSWNASPLDLCRLMARLRQFDPGSDARALIDEAYGAGGVLVGVRRHWDRAWYKGGGIPTRDGSGLDVLTHGWMVENGDGAYAVVVLSNGGPVDEFDSASVAQRLHRLLRDELS